MKFLLAQAFLWIFLASHIINSVLKFDIVCFYWGLWSSSVSPIKWANAGVIMFMVQSLQLAVYNWQIHPYGTWRSIVEAPSEHIMGQFVVHLIVYLLETHFHVTCPPPPDVFPWSFPVKVCMHFLFSHACRGMTLKCVLLHSSQLTSIIICTFHLP